MSRALVIILSCLAIVYAAYSIYSINHPFLADGANIEWSAMPTPTHKTIMVYTEGGQINQIVKGTKGSLIIYKADVTLPNAEKITIKVDETGKLIGLRYENDREEDFGNKKVSSPTR